MITKADIEAGISKVKHEDVIRRGKMFRARYTQLQVGLRSLALGEREVQIHYQSEYTYNRLRNSFNFRSVTMFAHRITVIL